MLANDGERIRIFLHQRVQPREIVYCAFEGHVRDRAIDGGNSRFLNHCDQRGVWLFHLIEKRRTQRIHHDGVSVKRGIGGAVRTTSEQTWSKERGGGEPDKRDLKIPAIQKAQSPIQ